MRMRLLVIWISLTALLQWSRAQEDNIQEVSLSGGAEGESPDKDEDPLPGSPGESQFLNSTTVMTTGDTKPAEGIMDSLDLPSDDGEVGDVDKKPSDNDKEGDIDKKPELEGTEATLGSEMDPKPEDPKTEPEIKGTNTPQPTDHLDQSPSVNQDSSSEVVSESPNKPQTSPGSHLSNVTDEVPTMDSHLSNVTDEVPIPESHFPNVTDEVTITDSHFPNITNEVPIPEGSPDYPADGTGLQEETTPKPTTGTVPPVSIPPLPAPLSCYSCMFCNASNFNDTKSLCPPIPGKKNGCRTILVRDPYTMEGKKTYINRGCISELDGAFLTYCNENKELCPTCYENICNVHNMTQFEETPGSASATHHLLTPFLISTICLASWQGLY
ncbi:pollen-specific leucine-rich repeat extensin-like protein 1 [Drosophila ficusphila]|uniref:pollen-specific leucine-rich repeat extensin-like protein 1 n=1 Tax=Drosophila ficusphila TaxID=30025 RepID=UPI0007E6A0FC|nr:pollen-specific leucine-rich repeat extensin-like protein 1 [Drosophila ficusphila]